MRVPSHLLTLVKFQPVWVVSFHPASTIMDDRYEQSATIIISQLPTEQWYQASGDNTLADAISDRLMNNAQRINLKGESMRKK
jgi:DNA replication protein DnaC